MSTVNLARLPPGSIVHLGGSIYWSTYVIVLGDSMYLLGSQLGEFKIRGGPGWTEYLQTYCNDKDARVL
jgi:hypothetical protein